MDGKRYETHFNKMPITKIFFLLYRTIYPLYDPDSINNFLRRMNQYLYLLLLVVDDPFLGNKAVVCALSASYVSTFAGYPVSRRLVLFLCRICLTII